MELPDLSAQFGQGSGTAARARRHSAELAEALHITHGERHGTSQLVQHWTSLLLSQRTRYFTHLGSTAADKT